MRTQTQRIEQLVDALKTAGVRITRQRKNGELFPCDIKMNVLRHADGRFKQTVVICTDQSERGQSRPSSPSKPSWLALSL